MAEYIRESRCGEIVPGLGVPDLIGAIQRLRHDYEGYRARARDALKNDFSQSALIAAHGNLYRTLTG